MKGEGNQIDFGARIYDSRLGRFLSVDPMSQSSPNLSPYQYASNSPVILIDVDGMFGDPVTNKPARGSGLRKVESAKIVQMNSQVKPGDVPWYFKLMKWGGRIGGTIGLVLTPMPATPLPPEMHGDETWYIKHPKNHFQEDENPDGSLNAGADYKARVVSEANRKPRDKNGTITLYRGVSQLQSNTPLQYTLARRGIAAPINYISDVQNGIFPMFITGHDDAFDHTGGDVTSIWTSWTMDRNIAVSFANMKHKGLTPGVVLSKVFKKSDLAVPTLDLGEKEWLVPGIVTGAKVQYVDAYGNNVPSEPRPPAPAVINNGKTK